MTDGYVILRIKDPGKVTRAANGGYAALNSKGSLEGQVEVSTESGAGTNPNALAKDRAVVAIAPTMPIGLVKPLGDPSPPSSKDPIAWGVKAIGAHESHFNGSSVTVAVLDTGIDHEHKAFEGVRLERRDFTREDAPAEAIDKQGHGTHCAGTIFGRNIDGVRIGVATGVTSALIGKVLDDDGAGSTSFLFRGLQWALDRGANIISMSLGFDFPGMVTRLIAQEWPQPLAVSKGLEAYRTNLRLFDAWMGLLRAREAERRDAIVIAATGNESEPKYRLAASLPAAAQGVISVGAVGLDPNNQLFVADFSNSNPALVAPGVNIVSAKRSGGLVEMTGTSMATPHVAGLAALWWQCQRDRLGEVMGAQVIANNLQARAQLTGFRKSETIAERGVGLAVAP